MNAELPHATGAIVVPFAAGELQLRGTLFLSAAARPAGAVPLPPVAQILREAPP